MKRSEGNFHMATTARTLYADKLFKPATIAATIDVRAKNGYRQYRVVQQLPFDLSETAAARALEEWLDQEQFHYIWRETYLEHDALRPVFGFKYPELEISW
ncbi:conserved hypothetical protein [Mesorhizobium plurifarium]|uniref:Uncharacterized protein n=1 Tax=Mesorhizobium plurifarium TaxID=69974 RepID=A0A090E2U3_MESPL|nr:conserved hypothetical protein [Mesorhizobium plurifarium]